MTTKFRSFALCSLAAVASLMLVMAPASAAMPLDPGYHASTISNFEMPALALVLPAEQSIISENRMAEAEVVVNRISPAMKPEYVESHPTHGLSLTATGRSR